MEVLTMRIMLFFTILSIATTTLPRSSTAQIELPPWALVLLLEKMHIGEISRVASAVIVRGSRVDSDGRTVPSHITCRLNGANRWYLGVGDGALITNERWPVAQEFCDMLFVAAHHQKDAQERR